MLKCLGADLTDDGIAWEHPTQGAAPNDELARSAVKLAASRLRELEDNRLSIQLAQSLLRYAAVGSPQHILMCNLVTLEQATVHDAAVQKAWQLGLGIEMSDDNWERATYLLKQGGFALGTVGNRASAAYLAALTRTMPEVLRRTEYDGVEALRRAAPALDRGIAVAMADLRGHGVPAEKVSLPMASGPSSRSGRISCVSLPTSDMRTVWLRWTKTDVDSSGRPLGPARRPFF